MATITTTHGDIDESLLVKTRGVIDNDVEHTEIVEYCLLGCDGAAHRTGRPEGTACFCPQHVHRSVAVALKQGLEISSVLEGF